MSLPFVPISLDWCELILVIPPHCLSASWDRPPQRLLKLLPLHPAKNRGVGHLRETLSVNFSKSLVINYSRTHPRAELWYSHDPQPTLEVPVRKWGLFDTIRNFLKKMWSLITAAASGLRQVAIKCSVCGISCFTSSKPNPRLQPVKNIDLASIMLPIFDNANVIVTISPDEFSVLAARRVSLGFSRPREMAFGITGHVSG